MHKLSKWKYWCQYLLISLTLTTVFNAAILTADDVCPLNGVEDRFCRVFLRCDIHPRYR